MKFSYDTRYTDNGFEMVPRVPVIFRNPKNGREIPIFCLIDSGASETLINLEIAKALGIDIERGEERAYGGVGGEVTGYRHTITMQVMKDRSTFTMACSVLPLPNYDGLLGREGFFENYKVVFEQFKNRFEVTAKKGVGKTKGTDMRR